MKILVCWLIGLLAWAAGKAAQIEVSAQVRDAWIRWLPGNLPAGGYLTLVNTGDVAISLVRADSADYGSVSIHQSRQVGGAMQMSPVSAIILPPHSALDFSTRGYHLMLLQPKRLLNPGDRIVITLNFASGGSIATPFELRTPDGGTAQH